MTSKLHTFEKHARHDHTQEHAILWDAQYRILVERDGDIDSVAFSPGELKQAYGGSITHNHPKGLPPSAADLAIAAEYGLKLRAVGTDETGKKWDYTIRFNNPSVELAQSIKSAFDEQVEIAEKELSTKPMSNRAWARESRHLALVRLSKTHDFNYDRVQINAPVSEMGRHEVKRLNILTHAEKSVKADWLSPLADSLGRIITNHADEKGKIPAYKLEMIRRQLSALVQRSFLGSPDANGALMPYTVLHGQVAPRSVYFKTLWGLMIRAATAAVERHAEIMRKYLPDDLIRQFEGATISPFDQVQEIGDFNPLHLFIGPDGKGLIDRIWNAAGDMAGRIDKFITAEVLRDLPASTIAQDLFNFLLPNKGTSLGHNGSFFATRLARTEISAAYFRADSMAAQLDPMVETYSPYTAPEHACCDDCDDIVAAGPYPKDDMTHLPPYHGHCICGVIWNLIENIPSVIERLRKAIQNAISNARRSAADVIGPLSKRFIAMLFGGKP